MITVSILYLIGSILWVISNVKRDFYNHLVWSDKTNSYSIIEWYSLSKQIIKLVFISWAWAFLFLFTDKD